MKYSEIIPRRVYAGGRIDRRGWRTLKHLDVDAIVNLTEKEDQIPADYAVELLWFPLGDRARPPLHRLQCAIEQTVTWLEAGKTVYIHDVAGRNRLGFFVTALMMRLHRAPYRTALCWAREARPQLSPRKQFIEVLKEYEEHLHV